MKRIVFFFFIAAVLVIISAVFFSASFVKSIAVKQLKSIFPGSEVSVASAKLSPLQKLALFDIRIKKEKVYEFKLKEVGVVFSPQALLRKQISIAYLKGAAIRIDLGSNSVVDFAKYINLSRPSVFLVAGLEVSDLSLDLKSKEASLDGKLSLVLDLLKQELESCDIKISAMDSLGVHTENAVLKVRQGWVSGELRIPQVKYDKAKIDGISGAALLKGRELSFSGLQAQIFGGTVQIEARVFMEANPEYAAEMKFNGLDIERFIKDFKLEEKFSMTGKLSGSVSMKGKGADIRLIDGNFSAGTEGGMMVIKDETMLKNMAKAADQPLDILMESFKDYHYNTGVMKLGKAQDDLSLDVALDGEKGKRNLTVTLHDFKLQ
ncbi:MAG: YdbH domain-containing protein [Candidatus Omnitrophica bacterium]|nr:YdbH domain-containing protein [Candidatus Omnitrophota bacterium]